MNKKVLFLLSIPPPVHGSSMVGKWIKESKIINDTFDCRYVNLGTSRTIEEIGKNPFGKISRYIAIIWQVFINLIKFKPDLCYIAITVKGAGFYKDSLIALIVKLFGIQIVYHFHNKGVSKRQNKFPDKILYQYVFHNAEIILLSNLLYPDIQKFVKKENVHICSNGIPVNKNNNNPKAIKNNKKPEILFLSNLIKTKGVFVLLEACKILKDKGIDFHCTFVGSEGDITTNIFLQKVNELGLEEKVIYSGKKYGLEKETVFANADIFVFPTYYQKECFPLVLLEAMQYNLAVVSTHEGGIPDIVRDGITGFLVPQQDVNALAEKIELLIKDKDLRQKMGYAGRIKYEKQFTLKNFEFNLKNILIDITTNK